MSAEVKSMDIKKAPTTVKDSAVSIKKAQNFVTDVKSEIYKIHWTNREELITYTKIVIGATFVAGMAIYTLDLSIQGALNTLNFMLQFLFG